MDLSLPQALKLFNQKNKTIVFNSIKHEERGSLDYYQVTEDVNLVHQIVNALYQMKIQSVIVEGGAKLLQSFIDVGLWDEARVIRNEKLVIKNGLAAPQLPALTPANKISISGDMISFFINQNDAI